MACSFQGSKCQGMGKACEGASQVVYEVKVTEEQYLCGPCAAENSHLIVPKNIGNTEWVCEKHKRHVEFFCETHDQEACSLCTMESHQIHNCKLQALEDVAADRKLKAENVLIGAGNRVKKFTQQQEDYNLKKAEIKQLVESKKNEIKANSDANLRSIKEEQERKISMVNKETDEAIKKIVDDRNAELRKIQNEVDTCCENIRKEEASHLDFIARIGKDAQNSLEDSVKQLKELEWAITENIAKVEMLLKDDRATLKNMKEALWATNESLAKKPPVRQNVLHQSNRCVKLIRQTKMQKRELVKRNNYNYVRVEERCSYLSDPYAPSYRFRSSSEDITSITRRSMTCMARCVMPVSPSGVPRI